MEQGKGDLVVQFLERDFQLHVQLERLWRFTPAVPWVTAIVVLGAGIYLTSQALTQPL